MSSGYFSILRIPHYLKNVYVFLPIFFSGQILNTKQLAVTTITFFSFCLAASAIYILNDIQDVAYDKLHPVKKLRAIPAGLVSIRFCYFLLAMLSVASLAIALLVSVKLAAIILLYCALNVCYCLGLKNIAIVDVAVISIGFVLRVVAGGVATGIVISHWLIIMVFLLSMFQALTKRMDDIYLIELDANSQSRKSLAGYNLDFLQIAVSMLSGVLLVCYIMYIVQPDIIARLGANSYGSTFFVLLGLLRYLQLTFVRKATGSPVKVLLNDKFIQFCIFCWVSVFAILIYFK
ncbi:hypothetical protein A0256_16780 [Mucilaginibacter sp. PAMC 26640]|nr:hypothetical protein A0256_16780 [Mucilaginibacter sp. PAMC 26640]